MSELFKRVLVAAIGIPLAMFIIYYGGVLFLTLLIIISSIALWEFYKIVEKKNAIPAAIVNILANIIFLISFYFFISGRIFRNQEFFLFLEIILFMLFSFIWVLFSDTHNKLLSVTASIGGFIYVTLSFSTLIGIRQLFLLRDYFFVQSSQLTQNDLFWFLNDKNCGWLLFSIFSGIWICDTAAYFIGRQFGKHKLMPAISPKKTWEGAIAGLVGAILGFYLVIQSFIPGFPIIHSIVIGIFIGTFGQVGDLAESMLKRDAGVKDSSAILPGHGGLLDRFDSILFAVPAIFIYLIIYLSN